MTTLFLGALTLIIALAWAKVLSVWIRLQHNERMDITLKSTVWYAVVITVVSVLIILALKRF